MLLKALKALYPNIPDDTLIRITNELLLDENANLSDFAAWIQGLITGYIIADSIKIQTDNGVEAL